MTGLRKLLRNSYLYHQIDPEIAIAKHDVLRMVWEAENIKQFHGTGWGVINAVSDFATHYRTKEKNAGHNERLFEKVIDGHELIDKAYELIQVAA
jgi:hypothetical protein